MPGQQKLRDICSLFTPGPDHRHPGIYCAPSQEGTHLNFLNGHDWGTISYEQGIHRGREARGRAAGLMENLQREGLSGRASAQRAWTLEAGAFLALGITAGVGSRREAHGRAEAKTGRNLQVTRPVGTKRPAAGAEGPQAQAGGWPALQRGMSREGISAAGRQALASLRRAVRRLC